jgi:hypothetical protein
MATQYPKLATLGELAFIAPEPRHFIDAIVFTFESLQPTRLQVTTSGMQGAFAKTLEALPLDLASFCP